MKKTYANGIVYDGELNASGEPHGHGKKTYPNGDFFEGEWIKGTLNGHGICVMGKERYNGDFKNDCFEGVGTYKYESGASYSGEWKNDRWHGEGTLSLADGTRLECEWEGGKISGDVCVVYPDGSKYEGALAPIRAKDEKDYVSGKIKIDSWRGKGVYTRADASSISGVWTDYMQGENLTLKSSDGRVATGKISDGEFIPSESQKKASVDFDKLFSAPSFSAPKGDEYEGETNRRGEYHGRGVLRYKSGEVFSGEFAYGEWYGYGLYVNAKGVTYYGYFTTTKESKNISLLNGINLPVRGKMKNGVFFPDED